MSKADHNKALGDLYPDLTPEELEEAERNLTEYVALALRVFHRLENDPEAYARFLELRKRRSSK